jgi:uncharacterized protein YqjF (DUF2071 family)
MASRLSPRARLARIRLAIVVHVAVIAGTPWVLGPGLVVDDALARRAYVADAPGAWPVAWGGWALTTLSLLLALAAWAGTLDARRWKRTALALVLAGGVIDWTAEAIWVWWAPGWAARAADPSGAELYACWDRAYQIASFGVANLLYCAAGLLLSAVSWRTAAFPRWLARASGLVWTASLAISAVGFAGRPSWIPLAAALGFVLFLPWLVLLGHAWLRAAEPGATSEAAPGAGSLGATLRALVPKHPLRMRTVFRDCFLVNFAVDPAVMRRLVPAPIEPALHDGAAYLSIVIARMDRMRPALLPRRLGVTYDQVVYRIVARHRGEPGVFFLRSDANNRLMCLAGDALTFFRFHRADIEYRVDGEILHLDVRTPSHQADIRASYDVGGASHELPRGSRFRSFAEAQRFLVELFTAFGHDPVTGAVSAVGIERGHWDVRVVDDRRACYQLMDGSAQFPAGSARLDSIFHVEQVPYLWHRLERRR